MEQADQRWLNPVLDASSLDGRSVAVVLNRKGEEIVYRGIAGLRVERLANALD